MATLSSTAVTLKDYKDARDPEGRIQKVIELLANQHGLTEDIMFRESNGATTHTVVARTGLPTVFARQYNKGTPKSKGNTNTIIETMSMSQSILDVDVDLLSLEGNSAEFLLMQSEPHLQAMRDRAASQFIYGDPSTDPTDVAGLAQRYPFKDAPNVVDFGGTGSDTTSIWLVGHGPNTVHGIFPKGSAAGLQVNHKGTIDATDADGNDYEADRTYFKWTYGLAVPDWRYVVRCCNIESAGLSGTGTNNLIDKLHLLIQAINLLESTSAARPMIYCNRDLKTQFDIAAYNKVGPVTYSVDAGGMHQTAFMGIPIRREDALLPTETALIATP
jgi:hypothetical protein